MEMKQQRGSKQIRRRETYPVIVLTAFLGGTLVDRAIAAGAAEILHKPFDLQSLHLAIERQLSADPNRRRA